MSPFFDNHDTARTLTDVIAEVEAPKGSSPPRFVLMDEARTGAPAETKTDDTGAAEVHVSEYLVHELLAGHSDPLTMLLRGDLAFVGPSNDLSDIVAYVGAVAAEYRGRLDPEGLPAPQGTIDSTRLPAWPDGAPDRLENTLEDQALVAAALVAAADAAYRGAALGRLYEAHDQGNLSARAFARFLISLADLAGGDSEHGSLREREAAEKAEQRREAERLAEVPVG